MCVCMFLLFCIYFLWMSTRVASMFAYCLYWYRGGTGHTTQNQRSSCRQGNTHQNEEARDTPPRGTCKREDPCRSTDATAGRALTKHNGLRKKPLLNHNTQPGAWTAPSAWEMHCRKATGYRADTHADTDTETPTQTHTDALVSDTTWTCV